MNYSVAIRTLASNPNGLKATLSGVFSQTVAPHEVVVYIAEGCRIPDFRVGNERYVTVKKGMVAQRALQYHELTTECILMLDDDIVMNNGVMSRLLNAMEKDHYDLLGADMFRTHELNTYQKLKAVAVALVLPHFRKDYGFILRPDGAFSYPWSPCQKTIPSDVCAGPLMLWRKSAFQNIEYNDEIWLDKLGFAYGDDTVMSYKASSRGMKVGVDFGAEVLHLNTKTASNNYRKAKYRFHIRAQAMTMTWWRMLYKPHGNNYPSSKTALAYGLLKLIWLSATLSVISVLTLKPEIFIQSIAGFLHGLRESKNKKLKPYS